MAISRAFVLLALIVCLFLFNNSFCMRIRRETDSFEENDKSNDLDATTESTEKLGEDTGKPSNAGDDRKPSDDRDNGKPSDGGDNEKSSDGGEDGKLSDGGDNEKPSDEGDDGKPSDGGDDEKPSDRGDDGKPSEDGDDENPSDGGDDRKRSLDEDDGSENKDGDTSEKPKDFGKGDDEDVDALRDDTLFVNEDRASESSTTSEDDLSNTDDSFRPSTTTHNETSTDFDAIIDDDELPFGGGFTFFSPFFSFEQVEQYFRKLGRDSENIFKRTMYEFGNNETNFKNSSDQIIEINGHKYNVHTTIIKGGDANSSISIEAISAVPIDKRRKRRSLW